MILVDSSASHNFVSAKVVSELGLAITKTAECGVVLSNGVTVPNQGLCLGMVVDFPGVEIVADFLTFDLWSSEIILGVQWLCTLGGFHKRAFWRNASCSYYPE